MTDEEKNTDERTLATLERATMTQSIHRKKVESGERHNDCVKVDWANQANAGTRERL